MPVKLHQLIGLVFICVVLLCLISACEPQTRDVPTQPSGMAPFPLEMTDQSGKLVRIESEPVKIISLAPSNTEIVYALGLQDKLVGVTKFCNYPEAAQQKPEIGGFSDVDIEKVVAIDPDLVLASNIHRDGITPELERLGIAVLTIAPKTIADVLLSIDLVGIATGHRNVAASVTTEMNNRIKAITSKTANLSDSQRVKVLYILWHDPLMTVSSVTHIHEIITKSGGINIAADLGGDYPTISLEAVLIADPQVIIAGSGHGSGQDVPFQFVLTEPRLAEVEARLQNQIYEVDADLTSRTGPRIVQGLEKLASFIHPELFEDSINGN
ncbi:ABC transporter substrate-binding protein [Chloroflexota bacterium]